MKNFRAVLGLGSLVFAVSLSHGAPAAADVVTWHLVDVAFSDGGTATGSFDWDADTASLSNWKVGVSGGNETSFPPATWTPDDSTTSNFVCYSAERTYFFSIGFRQVRLTPVSTLTNSGGDIALDLDTAGGRAGGVECYNCSPFRLIVSGRLHADPPRVCDVRAGNVNTGLGAEPVDVLFLNGSAGDACRELFHDATQQAVIDILAAPSHAQSHYAFWIYDGWPAESDATPVQLLNASGVVELGTGPRCYPSTNTVTPNSCPCPLTFTNGRTSRRLGLHTAARFCLNTAPGFPLAPVQFRMTIPPGNYTIIALVQDDNSVNSPGTNVSITNTLCVRSE